MTASQATSGVPPTDSIDNYVPTVTTTGFTLSDTWTKLAKTGTGVIDILLWLAGAILVISIILRSISYITSGGDASKASSARQGIINALMGLIFVTATYLIVRAVVAIVR